MKNSIMLINPFFAEGLKGFPLGLAYIAGALRKRYDVFALDINAISAIEQKDPRDVLIDSLKEYNPSVVGVTSTSPNHKNAIEAAKIVKSVLNVPIIKGGPHETNCAETTLKNNPEIDFSVVGEGENTIVELVDRIFAGKSAKGIKGVVYRERGSIINNGRRELITNLDILPNPERGLFYINDMFDKYYSASLFNGNKSTSIMTSRGCPYFCSFCSSKSNWGNIRYRSVENVVHELEELYSQGFLGFMFEDDMSLANRNWFFDFAQKIKRLGIEYSIQTRADAVDDEITRELSESGCKYMYFGIESCVQDILDRCKKGINIEEAKRAFEIARNYGIRNMASIQFGLPGEDIENLTTVRETIRVLNEELKPDEVAISYTSLYPGSPLSIQQGVTPEMYEIHINSINKDIGSKIAHGCSSIHPKGLTAEKIIEIEKIIKSELKSKRFETNTFYKR